MGLIKAALGAVNSTLADQWKEYFYCDALASDVLVVKGQKKVSKRSSNTKGNDNIITDGSIVAVANGQCMIIVENGKVVDFKAEEGSDVLERMLNMDEGAAYLGEAALVPCTSPVSQQNILFYNTLFDENASCHFALGACYPTNLLGGADLSDDELKARGGNISMNHVDFMVGTKDLSVTGKTADGREVQIFKDGVWVI